jgi:hypothetical protein
MKRASIATPLLLFLALVACGASSDGDAASEDGALGGTRTFACGPLKTDAKIFLEVQGSSLTLTVEGMSRQTGTLRGRTRSAATFGAFQPSDGVMQPDETLLLARSLLAGTGGTVSIHNPAVSPDKTASCQPVATVPDTCPDVIAHAALPLPGAAAAVVSASGDGTYRVSFPDAAAGDLIYVAHVTRDGLLCKVGAQTPVSCSAVVADRLLAQAGADALDAPPQVNHVGPMHYTGVFFDPEDGAATYDVTTSSDADRCTVVTVARAN